jgi:hypothetical protein
MNIATLIEKGTKNKLSYKLPDGNKISYRPLADWEFDEIDLSGYENVEDRDTLEYLYKLRDAPEETLNQKVPESIDIVSLIKTSKERTYWIGLKAIHEFYDDLEFNREGLEAVKKIVGFKFLVNAVLASSGRTKEMLDKLKFFRESGKLQTEENKASSK